LAQIIHKTAQQRESGKLPEQHHGSGMQYCPINYQRRGDKITQQIAKKIANIKLTI